MHAVMQQLHEDHEHVARLLRFIEDECRKSHSKESPDLDRLHQVMHYLRHYPDVFHHPREDLLFERLLERDPGCEKVINELQKEHEELARSGEQLRERLYQKCHGRRLKWPSLRQELLAYAELLGSHMEIEERQVFPLAKLLLADNDWEQIEARIRQREDPLIGNRVASPYANLINKIERGSNSP